jgi:hypothetical protein
MYLVHYVQVFWWYFHIFFYFVHYVQVFWWYFHIIFITLSTLYRCFGDTYIFFFTSSTMYRCFGDTFIFCLLCPLYTGVLVIISFFFTLSTMYRCFGDTFIFFYFVHFIQVFWCYFYIFTLPIDVTWYPVVISGSWEQMMYLIGWDHVGLLFVQWLSYWIIDHHFIWINEGYY